ncbi:MAG: hypothetical protein ABIK53_07555 [bacterium]
MKKLIYLILIITLFTTLCYAQDRVYQWDDSKLHSGELYGKYVTVEGTIVNTYNSGKAESLSSDYVPSSATRVSSDANRNDPIVYVTRTGKCYHRDSCSYLRKSKIPMKLSEARKLYRPCKRCKPPQ